MIFRRKYNFGIVKTDDTKYQNPYTPKTQDEVFNDVTDFELWHGEHQLTIRKEKLNDIQIHEIIESDDYMTIIGRVNDAAKYMVIPKSEIKWYHFAQKIINGHVYGDVIKDDGHGNMLLCNKEDKKLDIGYRNLDGSPIEKEQHHPSGWSPETTLQDEGIIPEP